MERQIGEVFQDGDVTLKVVETEDNSCIMFDGEKEVECHYYKAIDDCTSCEGRDCSMRSDLKFVIFVKQD